MSELKRAVEWDNIAGNTTALRHIDDDLPQLYFSLIEEEREELLAAIYALDRVEVLDALGDLLKVVSGAVSALGYCPEKLLQLVNDSNYSKFCVTKEQAVISVAAYEQNLRYEDVYYEQVGDLYIIRGYEKGGDKVGKGKILKGYAYAEPDIKQYHWELYGDVDVVKSSNDGSA